MVNIYVLRLIEGKYYVGTAGNVVCRINSHFRGEGVDWTRKYRPIDIEEVIPNQSYIDEDTITKKYMLKYGIDNVRGGTYCGMRLGYDEYRLLKKEMMSAGNRCYRCASKDHKFRECPFRSKRSNHFKQKRLVERVVRQEDELVRLNDECDHCGMICICDLVLDSQTPELDFITFDPLEIDYIWENFDKEDNGKDDIFDDFINVPEADLIQIWKSFQETIEGNLGEIVDICLKCEELGHCFGKCTYDKSETEEVSWEIDENFLYKKRLR